MTPDQIQQLLASGEDSRCEFKSQLPSPEDLAQDLSAFGNSGGGILLIGVKNDGKLRGLDPTKLDKYQQTIANVASNNIQPALQLTTQNLQIDGYWLLSIVIEAPKSAPYMANDKDYYYRQGASARPAPPTVLARLFANSKQIHIDERKTRALVAEQLVGSAFGFYLDSLEQPLSPSERADKLKLLQNINLAEGEYFNLAGLLLFGREPERFEPTLGALRCCYFADNLASTNAFNNQIRVVGRLELLYEGAMTFLQQNLRHVQVGRQFNQTGELELDPDAITEALVNALVHRDLTHAASVKVFLFPDRLEITSPGSLPNNLSVEKILAGSSIARNQTLCALAQRLLPHRSLGTGIRRIKALEPQAEFINAHDTFTVRLPRKTTDS